MQTRRRRIFCSTRLGRVAVLPLLVCACATPPPPLEQPSDRPAPIHLEEAGSPPIYFEKILLRIPAGAKVESVYEMRSAKEVGQETWGGLLVDTREYNIAITDRLAAFGYDAVDPTDALFRDGAVATRFRLVGVLTDLKIHSFVRRRHPFDRAGNVDRARSTPFSSRAGETRYLGVKQEASIELVFKLYDAAVERVIYDRSFRGFGREEGPTGAVATDDAVRDAVDRLLSDPDFVWAVTEPSEGSEAAFPPPAGARSVRSVRRSASGCPNR